MEFLAWSRLVLLSLVLLSALLTLFAPLRAVGAQHHVGVGLRFPGRDVTQGGIQAAPACGVDHFR